MTKLTSSRWYLPIFALASLAPWWLVFFGITLTIPIERSTIKPWQGHAFTVLIPREGVYGLLKMPTEPSTGTIDTNLQLFEDGILLPGAQASNWDIALKGEGRHRRDGDFLVMSSSDGSRPTRNERAYGLTIREFLPVILAIIWSAILLALGRVLD